MAMTGAPSGLGTLEQDANAGLLTSTGDLVDAILVVEYRLAMVAALAERFGTRYAGRATIELQAAVDALAAADARRRAAVAAMTELLGYPGAVTLEELVAISPEPLRSTLAEARGAVLTARERVNVLRRKADDVLGRRIALIVEALASPGGPPVATYGRDHRPGPRLVNGML
jgi:hypothetical protein